MENLEHAHYLYKQLREKSYEVGTKLIIYNSIYGWNDLLSNKEVETVAGIIYDVYMSAENCDITILADNVSEALLNGLTSKELKSMSKYDILEKWGE